LRITWPRSGSEKICRSRSAFDSAVLRSEYSLTYDASVALPDAFVVVTPAPRERARPLSPDERRATIIDAVLPLVKERGRDVSTKEIAEAAGVAEGTIFRAFGDKESLIEAAVEKLLDPLPLRAALRGIDPELPLEQKLNDIIFHLRARFLGVFGIMTALGMRERPPMPRTPGEEWLDIISDLLAPNGDELGVPIETVAHYLRLVAFASSIPPVNENYQFHTDELAQLITRGVMRDAGKKS
jgi:AcrR family transcriptional regulator